MNLHLLLQKMCNEGNDKISFQWFDENTERLVKKSYLEFAADIKRAASFFSSMKLSKEKLHIGILAQNSYQYAVSLMGIIGAGAVVVPLNIKESRETLLREMYVADVSLVLKDREYFDLPEDIMSLNILTYLDSVNTKYEIPNNKKDFSILMFTSGTTGTNKCVMLSEQNMFAAIAHTDQLYKGLQITMKQKANSFLLLVPIYHISAILAMCWGFTELLQINMCNDLKNIVRDNSIMLSDITFGVPVLLQMWVKYIKRGHKEILGSLSGIVYGGASLDSNIIKIFDENGISIAQSYGLTETFGAGITNNFSVSKKYASLGIPVHNLHMKLDKGEICLKGDAVMKGYYKDSDSTEQVLKDGWFYSGDIGELAEDGYINMTGRKKNLIVLSSGENVSPEELEQLIYEKADVQEVVVKEKNNKICAEVFCNQNYKDMFNSIISEINKTLPLYKHISLIEYRECPFPRTSIGKIIRSH